MILFRLSKIFSRQRITINKNKRMYLSRSIIIPRHLVKTRIMQSIKLSETAIYGSGTHFRSKRDFFNGLESKVGGPKFCHFLGCSVSIS